ncbi:hypothetical protein TRVL_02009 [Trypanosoma vivax]|nr:hypothetical protein TRVL_02009 [Trypanosoma vivax]
MKLHLVLRCETLRMGPVFAARSLRHGCVFGQLECERCALLRDPRACGLQFVCCACHTRQGLLLHSVYFIFSQMLSANNITSAKPCLRFFGRLSGSDRPNREVQV